MLALSRFVDEEFLITVPPSTEPTIIRHTTIDVRGDRVRHGWSAPKEVQIDRLEIAQAKEREKKLAEQRQPCRE